MVVVQMLSRFVGCVCKEIKRKKIWEMYSEMHSVACVRRSNGEKYMEMYSVACVRRSSEKKTWGIVFGNVFGCVR